MSSGSWATLIALLLCVTAGPASGVVAGVSGGAHAPTPAPAGPPTSPAAASGLDGPLADLGSTHETNTTMGIQLRPNGNARWTVTAYFDLETANETAAFRELAERFEAGDASALGLEAFRRARDEASSITGRDMVIRDVQRSSAPASVVENGTGWLRLTFTWTNFGDVDGDRLVVGDAFRSTDGVWLSSLASDQTLVMHAPENWAVVNANTSVTEATLTWRGPTALDRNSLAATFTGSRTGVTPTSTATPVPPASSNAWLWPAVAAALGLVGLVGAYLVVRRREDLDLPGTPTGGDSDGPPDGDAPATELDDGESGSAAEPVAAPTGEEAGVDPELLSDEERVERLLEDNGGRMKQASIVKETGWSNAKVSQLLSSMHEEGQIDKLRIGRENLISFPDEDLTDVEDESS